MTSTEPTSTSTQENIPLAEHVVQTGVDRYEKLGKLGEGTYGIVYNARDKVTQEFVALKKVRMEAWEEGVPATTIREISVLKEIPHENIVE